MDPLNSYQGNYQPYSGKFGDVLPYLLQPLRIAPLTDTFQPQNPESKTKPKLPWYITFGKEVLINGLTIAASIAGGFAGGVVGAMVAGSLTSAVLGFFDQKLTKGKVNWGSVMIDGALGLIPGSVAESLAKGGSKLLARITGKTINIGAKDSVKRGIIIGATDGVVMGAVGGFSQSAYDSYQHDGKVDWTAAIKNGFKAIFAATLGGAIGAGSVMAIRGRTVRSQNSGL